MKTSSAKAKGRRLQQHVVNVLRQKYCKPHEFEAENIMCTIMGESGRDVRLSPEAERRIPFDIECKNTESASPWSWMEQAQANTKENRVPLVVFKRNHSEVYCMLKFDDLIKLL